jgi:hypothetical protein
MMAPKEPTRMANGSDSTVITSSSSSSLVRIILEILKTNGPSVLIAIGLTGVMIWLLVFALRGIDTAIEANHQELIGAKVEMTRFAAKQNEYDRVRQELLEKQLRLLRQLCVNSSKSDVALKACVE